MNINTPAPLTDEEVLELDGYGNLSARGCIPVRAAQLWEREILWGRVNSKTELNAFNFDHLVSTRTPGAA